MLNTVELIHIYPLPQRSHNSVSLFFIAMYEIENKIYYTLLKLFAFLDLGYYIVVALSE